MIETKHPHTHTHMCKNPNHSILLPPQHNSFLFSFSFKILPVTSPSGKQDMTAGVMTSSSRQSPILARGGESISPYYILDSQTLISQPSLGSH